MDGDAGMALPSSSPSAETSPSSSDVDTESTGSSFFRDRSTTLGTLMGVSFADGEEEEEEEHREAAAAAERGRTRAAAEEEEGRRWRRTGRRRRGGWWRLCRDDVVGSTSLGQFLHMERKLSGDALLCGDGGEERNATAPAAAPAVGEESGKWKLRASSAQGSSSLARLPVLLTAICSGGA